MRVANVDGLVTLFYDGSKELWNGELEYEWLQACRIKRRQRNRDHVDEDTGDIESLDISDECKSYLTERLSWQQIIVVDGVTEIPDYTFCYCYNIRKVIFADTVIRIQRCAFCDCKSLVFIKWSISLECIGDYAFQECNLSSVFIPTTCREIGERAFSGNKNLSILNIPLDTQLERYAINSTKLLRRCPYKIGSEMPSQETINTWLKNMNNGDNFALHRACASYNPLKEVIHAIILQNGPRAFRVENSAGITPSQYLKGNPYTDLSEKEIIHDYLNKMMGFVARV